MEALRESFKKYVTQKGMLSKDQISLVLDFHQFEGRKRHPAEVAVSLSVLSEGQAREVARAMKNDLATSGATDALSSDTAATSAAMDMDPQEAIEAHLQDPDKSVAQGTTIGQLLSHAIDAGASDLHVHAGQPPFMRIEGIINDGFAPPMTNQQLEAEARQLLNKAQQKIFHRQGSVNLCVGFSRGYRLRINFFKTQHGLSMATRMISPDVPTFAGLNLPEQIDQLIGFHQGLVLVSGPANSGKTTTLAALISKLNANKALHIVTIEDPIEVVHTPRRCSITQRQVQVHTSSYASALKAALREDPDVIVIGEMRDMETMRVALNAAETGHLVLGTLHTRSVESTVARVLDAFGEEEIQMRGTLADALKGVFVQQLVRSQRGGQVPAVEMLLNNSAVAHCIRKRKLHQLQSLMQSGRGQGMILWEDSVRDLQKKRLISSTLAQNLLKEEGRMM